MKACSEGVSKSTIYRRVRKSRSTLVTKKTNRLISLREPLQVHWDGKKIKSKIFLVVNITSANTKETIGVKSVSDGNGKTVANKVLSTLETFGIANNFFAACFDTTSTNSGK